jgi:hypothetical protein
MEVKLKLLSKVPGVPDTYVIEHQENSMEQSRYNSQQRKIFYVTCMMLHAEQEYS